MYPASKNISPGLRDFFVNYNVQGVTDQAWNLSKDAIIVE